MEWDLDKIEQFYVSAKSNPAEFDRLIHKDPVGKMWSGFRQAEQAFHDAKRESQALGIGDSSINPARSQELADELPVLMERRRRLLNGLNLAVQVLNGKQPEEPTVRSLEAKIVGLQRGRGDPKVIASTRSLISELEGIANLVFNEIDD
jgi:hypothetical protein